MKLSLPAAGALALATGASLCAPARSAPAAQITWNHVVLGMPASGLRTLLGDPLRVLTPSDGSERIARYWLPGSRSTFFLVFEQRGYVKTFEAFTSKMDAGRFDNVPPDPQGIRLGDTLAHVRERNPAYQLTTEDDGTPSLTGRSASPAAGVGYEFASGLVRSFMWVAQIDPSLPLLPQLADPAGDTPAAAILDVQANEADGVAWEYMYVAFHPCDGEQGWKVREQTLVRENGHAYDRLHAACPSTNAERDFYFNIDSYYGKL